MGMHFKVEKINLEVNKRNIKRACIVLCDDDNDSIIYALTDFHKYIKEPEPKNKTKKKKAKDIKSFNKNRYDNINKFLNYLFFDKKLITSLDDLTKDMVEQYLNDYGLHRLSSDNEFTHRKGSTVDRTKDDISNFLRQLCKKKAIKVPLKEFAVHETYLDLDTGEVIKTDDFDFETYYEDYCRRIFRDFPKKVMDVFMNVIKSGHKRILMAVTLQKCAFLRGGEACNVRREDSLLGPGISFDIINGEVCAARIDLSKELRLRSDAVNVGGIKKERVQEICPLNLTEFCDNYNIYMEYINGRSYEEQNVPLNLNRDGKALTYDAYKAEFKIAIRETVKILLKSSDPELVLWGHKLSENNVNTHILRHYASVQYVLSPHPTLSLLMTYRGDTSSESSNLYLINKSELNDRVRKVNDYQFEYNQKIAKEKYGKH